MADAENRANWSRPELHHWAEPEWEKFITPNDLRDLKFWKPETELELVHLRSHLESAHIRAAQRFVHAFFLPILDRLRPKYPPDARPQPIPANIVKQLEHELAEM